MRLEGFLELLGLEGVQVLVGVVQHRAEVGHHVGQAAVNCVNPPGEGPGELAGGLPGGGGGLRLNEVDDRLGLGQVQLSVEEGPLGGPWGSRGIEAPPSPPRCSCGEPG